MPKKEYIERDSIYRRVKERTNPYGKPTLNYESGVKVLNMIEREPAADVVEVVRCKDCLHGQKNNIGQLKGRYICEYHQDYKPMFSPHHYCSHGERKEQT